MSEWKTLKQDIERLHKRSQEISAVQFDEIWDMHGEQLFLRESLNGVIPEIEIEELFEMVRNLAESDQNIHQEIYSRSQSCKDEAKEWLENRIGEFEKKVRTLLGNTEHSSAVITDQLQTYADELMFLKRLAIHLEEDRHQSILPDVFSEIHYLIVQAAQMPDLFSDDFISTKLAELRTDALQKEVAVFERESVRILEQDKNAKKIWGLLSWGNSIQPNLSRRNPVHIPLHQRCSETRAKIRETISQILETCEPEEKFRLAEKFVLDIQEQANEAVSSTYEKSLAGSIKTFLAMRENTLWAKKWIEGHLSSPQAPKELRKTYKKIIKADRFLKNEIQEKKLQERMEKIFGHRFVVVLENTILFLILFVIVLLTIESTTELSPAVQQTFLVIDTLICAVFLAEFLTKWFLAEGKWLYLWRHFFLDFLPSLPYGLIATGLESLHYARSVRMSRFLKLPQLIRYVRIARPLVRVFRVITFMLRGIDRLVKRYASFLNRNIIFFGSPEEVSTYLAPSLKQRIRELRGMCLSRSRTIFSQTAPEESRPYIMAHLATLEVHLKKSNGGLIVKDTLALKPDILVEDLLNTLLRLKANQLEEFMGRDFAYMIHQTLSIFNAPVIRRIPGIKSLIQKHKEYSAPEFVSWLGRSFGRVLERLLAIAYWFSDMYGIVTGPRLLDKVGTTMVISFKSPARKLLMIGGIFLLTKFLVNAIELPFLDAVVNFLNRYVGTPLIVIGSFCMLPLLLGMWLRNIAGEATEFYEKTAEAQFINLLKILKWYNKKEDLKILYYRVLYPEAMLLCDGESDPCDSEGVVNRLLQGLSEWENKDSERYSHVTTRQEARRSKLLQQVLLLYKDYLDGALMHNSDVKTTEQLLGNITLGNIRVHRLEYTRKEFKELERLDLSHHHIFTGPYLWFSLITQSISHNTAKLIIDYNKHCIPENMLELQSEEAKSKYRKWIDRRLQRRTANVTRAYKKPEQRKRKNAVPLYMTSHFTALHFLMLNKSQEDTIRFDFGEDIHHAFLKDRMQLIRHVFGTHPLHSLPKPQRSLNLYQLYQEHLWGGRTFTLPFKMLLWTFQGIGLLLKWLLKKLKEILHPLDAVAEVQAHSDFNVVIRKINRMRKPLYMACMKLRAKFDFEYLGLHIPGTSGVRTESGILCEVQQAHKKYQAVFEKDLDFIRALDGEYDYFNELRNKRKKTLHQFCLFLKQKKWDRQGFMEYLRGIDPGLVSRKNEILRALAIAYTIDYRRLASLIHAKETLEEEFKKTIESRGNIPGYGIFRKIFMFFYWMAITLAYTQKNWEWETFEQFWKDTGYGERHGKKEKKWCWNVYRARRKKLREVLHFISKEGDVAVIDEIISQIVKSPGQWTEELIAVRTIQTLAVMDVQNYRRHIANLGDYPEKANYETPPHAEKAKEDAVSG